jgi:DNA-binding GntR family transcriptional regulator
VATTASASERAYKAIRERVLNGAYQQGTMLGEESLATEIGVSRTPVRTALTKLQDEGWITIYPKRGALVQGLSDRTVADLADARLVLESAAPSRASAEVRDQLANRLSRSIDAQREAFRDNDVRRFIELTIAFHRAFVEASGNSVLLELNDRLADRQRFLLFSHGDRLLARCNDIIAEHKTLVEHLRKGDAPGFAEALRGHLTDTYASEYSQVR